MTEDLGRAELELDTDQSGLDRGLDQSKRKTQGFLDDFRSGFKKSFSQGIGQGVGIAAFQAVAGGIQAVGDALVDSVKKAADFERGMLNVQTISGGTTAQLKAQGEAVLTMSGKYGQGAKTMVDALYDITSSGFKGADAMKVLDAAAMAATAGLTSTGTAAAGLAAVLNAYGLKANDAGRISDVMFQTVNRGVITFEELSASIGTTTALAAPLGVSFEEVSAAVAVLTRNGIDAENSMTQINAIMSSMLKPSAEATKLAKQLGLDWSATGLRANGLTGQMVKMIAATRGNEESMAALLGDARAIRGAFVLAKQSGAEFTAELGEMTKAGGATGDAFGIQKNGAAFKFAQMNAKIEAAEIRIGQKLLPVAVAFVGFLETHLIPALEGVGTVLGALTGQMPENEEGWKSLANTLNGLNPITWGYGAALNSVKRAEEEAAAAAAAAAPKFSDLLGPAIAGTGSAVDFLANKINEGEIVLEDGALKFRTASNAAGAAIEGPIKRGASFAVRGVTVMVDGVLAEIRRLRDEVGASAQEAADEIFDPIQKGLERERTLAELAADQKKLRDKKITGIERTELQERVLQNQKALMLINSDLIFYGTDAEIISKAKAELASAAWRTAWEEGTPQAKAAIEAYQTDLRLTIDGMERDAAEGGKDVRDGYTGELRRGVPGAKAAGEAVGNAAGVGLLEPVRKAGNWGYLLGKAYADGIRSTRGLINDAAYYAAAGASGAFKASSPPGPESPLHEIDKWGARTGLAWMEPFVAAIQGGRAALRSALGGVGVDLASVTGNVRRQFGAPDFAFADGGGMRGRGGGGDTFHTTYNVRMDALPPARDPLAVSRGLIDYDRHGLLPRPRRLEESNR